MLPVAQSPSPRPRQRFTWRLRIAGATVTPYIPRRSYHYPRLLVCLSIPPFRALPRNSTARYTSQEQLCVSEKKRKNAEKQKACRGRQKTRKAALKRQEKTKWGNLGGVKKQRMRIHQYDKPAMRRIAQLGTSPTDRGSFIPTARISPNMI